MYRDSPVPLSEVSVNAHFNSIQCHSTSEVVFVYVCECVCVCKVYICIAFTGIDKLITKNNFYTCLKLLTQSHKSINSTNILITPISRGPKISIYSWIWSGKVSPTLTPGGEVPGLTVPVLLKTLNPEGFPDFGNVVLPKLNFDFFSAGFRIWKEHIRVSSTLIMAPALSNSPQ